LELLTERGSAFSVEELIRRAGVTKTTLYYHFRSKEALIREVLQVEIRGMQRALDVQARSPEEQLQLAVQGLADWAAERPQRLRLLVLPWQPDSGLRAQTVRRLQKELVNLLAKVLLAGQAARLLDPSWPTELLAVALYGALGHVVEHLRRQGHPLNPKELSETLLAFLLRRPVRGQSHSEKPQSLQT
jgi:AcrR family transcriptional regulator